MRIPFSTSGCLLPRLGPLPLRVRVSVNFLQPLWCERRPATRLTLPLIPIPTSCLNPLRTIEPIHIVLQTCGLREREAAMRTPPRIRVSPVNTEVGRQ